MRGKRLLASCATVVMAVSLAACGGDDDDDGGQTLGAEREAEEAELVARDNRFEPRELRAKQGQEITFTFHNEDEVKHNFRLAFLDIDQDVDPGQSVDIKLTATEPPENLDFYYFFCKYHQTEGMQGQLKVEP